MEKKPTHLELYFWDYNNEIFIGTDASKLGYEKAEPLPVSIADKVADLNERNESSIKPAKIAEERPPVGFRDSAKIVEEKSLTLGILHPFSRLPKLRMKSHLTLGILLKWWKKGHLAFKCPEKQASIALKN